MDNLFFNVSIIREFIYDDTMLIVDQDNGNRYELNKTQALVLLNQLNRTAYELSQALVNSYAVALKEIEIPRLMTL